MLALRRGALVAAMISARGTAWSLSRGSRCFRTSGSRQLDNGHSRASLDDNDDGSVSKFEIGLNGPMLTRKPGTPFIVGVVSILALCLSFSLPGRVVEGLIATRDDYNNSFVHSSLKVVNDSSTGYLLSNIYIKAGGTASGKTAVVKRIVAALDDPSVAILPQDCYYRLRRARLAHEVMHSIVYEFPIMSLLLSHELGNLFSA